MQDTRTMQVWPGGASVTVRGQSPYLYVKTRSVSKVSETEQDEWRRASPEELRDIDIAKTAERLVRNEVLCCDSSLLSELMSYEPVVDGFNFDEIERPRLNASEASLEECKEYLEEQGVDVPEREVQSDEDWLEQLLDNVQEGCDELVEAADEDANSEEEDEPDPVVQNAGEEARLLLDRISTGAVDLEQAQKFLDDHDFAYDEREEEDEDDYLERLQTLVEETQQDESEPEIYEWWRVSEMLARNLKDIGESILDNGYGTWWGRTCTGQSMLMDGTIQRAAAQIEDRCPTRYPTEEQWRLYETLEVLRQLWRQLEPSTDWLKARPVNLTEQYHEASLAMHRLLSEFDTVKAQEKEE